MELNILGRFVRICYSEMLLHSCQMVLNIDNH